MRYLDFFAGIGGFHSAFSRVGWECLGYCEIDRFARQSYRAIHNTEGAEEWHDITAVTNEHFRTFRGRVDLISGGFPCQAFSVAGRQLGFEDTRGTLFFEIARAAKEIQPRYLLLENVKNLISHDKGNTFGTILNTLHELGYAHIEWGIFNSKYWGVPQNRERVFILAELRDEPTEPYLLPLLRQQEENGVESRLRDILESNVDTKYFLEESKTSKLLEELKGKLLVDSESPQMVGRIDKNGHDYLKRVYSPSGVSNTLCTMQGGGQEPKIAVYATLTPDRVEKRQQGRRFKGNDEPAFTLNTQDRHGVTVAKPLAYQIRKLTPLECWRLQDFTDEQFEMARADGISDSQLYKQAGNSVTVKVVEVIAKQIQSRL